MTEITPKPGSLHVVEDRLFSEGQVLEKFSAAGGIHDLHAPADGKDRFRHSEDIFQEKDLKYVCFYICLPGGGEGRTV